MSIVALLSLCASSASADTGPVSAPQIVPLPTTMTALDGQSFTISPDTRIAVAAPAALPVADELASILRPSTGYALPVSHSPATAGDISLALTDAGDLGREGYTLDVTAGGIALAAAQPAGLFYGIQSLRQLLPPWAESATVRPGPWTVPGVRIADRPRYEHRGVMLDIARHFQTPAAVKRLIDSAVAYKINVLHLHVSDDQGFRIVINGRPELTQIGGQFSINNDPGGYWTQAEYKDVVAYATAHFMSVIPEVDTPGHNNSIIMSYNTPGSGFPLFPDINCSNRQPASWLLTGAVGYSALCPSSPNTWAILDDIITQLSAMSTSPYYNLGGDEVPASLMAAATYNAFVDQETALVRSKGKIPMGWAEISAASLEPDQPAAVQFWNNGNPTGSGGDTARRAAMKGMKVVMSPANHTYLDMKQFSGSPLGLSWACTCDVTPFYNWGATAPTGDLATYIPARTQSTTAVVGLAPGATKVHLASVSALGVDQPLSFNTPDGVETATITSVGTAQGPATALSAPAEAGATNIKVNSVNGFTVGQLAIVDTGDNYETAEIAAVGTAGAAGTGITLATPLSKAHAGGATARNAGSGVTFTPALTKAHATGVPVSSALPAVTDEHIIGIEGPLWSETLVNIDDIEFQAFPRLPALAELGWSPKVHPERTLASFQSRMASHGARWQAKGQNFYPSAQIPWRIDVAAADKRLAQGVIDGELATIAAPGATPEQLTATIEWGDGTSSPATVTGTAATNKTANRLYSVSASHTYPRPGGYAAKLTVTRGTATRTASFDVVVDAIAEGSAGGTVPATLALSLGSPASFGAFTPGVSADYTATQTAGVVSTAGDATLTVADASLAHTGRLVNGAFALGQPLQATATSADGSSTGPFAPVGGSAGPLALLAYAAPVSNDAVTVTFKQSIGASEALRTGSYSKTLVFTLSTITP